MKIITATLCDFAQVREGLLSIMSGGVTRVWRDEYPAPMGLMLALIFEVSPDELANVIEVRCRVEDEDGIMLGEGSMGAQGTGIPGLDAGELLQVPSVLDLRGVELKREGRYLVRAWSPQGEDPTVSTEVRLAFAARPHPNR